MEQALAGHSRVAALEEAPRERVPLQWALAHMNLGNALLSLGERESGTVRLAEAVAAYRLALQAWTRERVALNWATTQMNFGTVLSILLMSVTPFIGGIFVLLVLAQALRGWLQGVVQPVMFSVQAKAVGRYQQGSVVGLRQSLNRLAAIVIPPVMGAIADQWGAGTSFVVLGTVLLVLSAPVALIARRAARVESSAIFVQSQTPRTEAR